MRSDQEPELQAKGAPAARLVLRKKLAGEILEGHQETLEHEEAMWQQVLEQQEEHPTQKCDAPSGRHGPCLAALRVLFWGRSYESYESP
eukprot:g23847.t1